VLLTLTICRVFGRTRLGAGHLAYQAGAWVDKGSYPETM